MTVAPLYARLATLIATLSLTAAVSGQIRPMGYTTPTFIDFETGELVYSEDATNIVVTVFRTGEFRVLTAIDFWTTEIDATEGQDYSGVGGTLVFQPGEGYKTITIPVHSDIYEEGTESFLIELGCDDPNVLFYRTSETVFIEDARMNLASTPKLQIHAGARGHIILSWTDRTNTYGLERADSTLADLQWAAVETVPTVDGSTHRVEEPADGTVYFYRLKAGE